MLALAREEEAGQDEGRENCSAGQVLHSRAIVSCETFQLLVIIYSTSKRKLLATVLAPLLRSPLPSPVPSPSLHCIIVCSCFDFVLARGNKKQKRVACKSGQTNVVHSAGVRMEGGRAGRGGVRRWETAEVGQAKKQRLKVCCKIFATKEKCRNKNEKKNKLNAAGNKF